MREVTTLSEPRWTPKCVDDVTGDGYWEVDVIYETFPTSWWDRWKKVQPTSSKYTYLFLTFSRDHVSCLGWIDTQSREEVSMHSELAKLLEDKVEALLREEKIAAVTNAQIERVAP